MSENKGRFTKMCSKSTRKSQIAIEHCYRFRHGNPNSHVFWVNGSSVQRFEQAYAEISRRLKLPGCNDPKVNKLALVSDWLSDETHEPWLLLLDNTDDESVFFNAPDTDPSQHANTTPLIRYIPQSQNGSVLVTSRNRKAAFRLTDNADTIVDVPLMDEETSKLVLSRKLSHDQSTDGEMLELVKQLDYLPLAIAQAAAFISMRKPRMTIARYSAFLRENEDILLEDMGDLRRDPDMPNSVIKTWHISFNQIKKDQPQSAELFSLMSVLDRQGLPDYLFSKGGMDLDFENNVARLIEFSLLTPSIDGRTFGMHRLVQIAMKRWLDLHDETQKWKEMALDLLHRSFPLCRGPEDWRGCEIVLPHAESVLGYEYDQSSQCLLQADVNYNVASYYYDAGNYSLARERFQQTLDVRCRLLDEGHLKVLDCIDLLAISLDGVGLPEQAIELWQWTLPWRLKGENALSRSLFVMRGLSAALHRLCRWEEAEKMTRRRIRTSQELHGKEHVSTQGAVIELAGLLLDQGKGEEAEIVLRQTISLHQTGDPSLSQDFPRLDCLTGLAIVFHMQRRYQEAEELGLSALKGFESLLGPKHSITLETARIYAIMLLDNGKLDLAERMVRRAFSGHEKLHGSGHPYTLSDLFHLSSIQNAQGELELAEETGLQALRGYEKMQGDQHLNTIKCKGNLALVYWKQKRHQEAISLLTDVLKGYENAFRKGHPDIATIKRTINVWQREVRSLQNPLSLEGETIHPSAEEMKTD